MPFKKIKRAVKKITKPIAKVLDKVVPNEIKPALPYLAAFTPFMFGPTFGTGFGAGIFKTAAGQQMAARALASGAANLGAQLSQEGSEGDFSLGSLAIASGLGALSAPGAQDAIAGSRFTGTPGVTGADAGFYAAEGLGIPSATPQGFIGKGLTKAAEGVQATGKVLRDPFSATLKDVGKAAFTPLTQGTTDLAMATARKALKDYEDELAAYELETGEAQTASDTARRTAVIEAMTAGQHSDDVINETLTLLGLDTLLAKDGGVVKMKDGGIMDLGGKEMDLRGGGFVPIGKKERADDVPARLSKNEFVMTADAVRGAGGGNINEGARRMYETMNKLEARA
jgi:hypothetical protein